jgi:hypothetical protein
MLDDTRHDANLKLEQEGWPPRHAPACEPSSNTSPTGSAKAATTRTRGCYCARRCCRLSRSSSRATGAAFGPPFLLASVPNSVEIGRQGRVAAVGEHMSNLLRQDTF